MTNTATTQVTRISGANITADMVATLNLEPYQPMSFDQTAGPYAYGVLFRGVANGRLYYQHLTGSLGRRSVPLSALTEVEGHRYGSYRVTDADR